MNEQEMESKDRIVERILDIEVEMFLRVPTGEEPSCRVHLEDMKLHRRGQFAGWSPETCRSYLKDLRQAKEAGRNLMTLKYARMDNLVDPLSESPRIDQIHDQYVQWQQEIIRDYPNLMRRGRDLSDFSNYLRSELETYSDETLEMLSTDVHTCAADGRNLSLETYRYLARQSGYASLEEMEARLA